MKNFHPTVQKVIVLVGAIGSMLLAFNWLTPERAQAVTAVIVAACAFWEPSSN